MASTVAEYCNPGAEARTKTGDAKVLFRPSLLRRAVRESMVRVHRISPELAAYHVSQMDLLELCFRARKYAGMELSATGPNPREANESSTRFSRPQRRRQADGALLHSRTPPSLPESGKEQPGPEAGAFFAPAAAQVGSKKPGKPDSEDAVSGKGFCF